MNTQELRDRINHSSGVDKSIRDEVLMFLNTTVAAQLRKFPSTTQGEVEHIVDYLLSNQAPRRLRKMSYEEAKLQSEVWTRRMNRKSQGIVETDEDVRVLKLYKTSGLCWVELVGEAAYKREGLLMSHCVASYHGKSNSQILSLRDSDNNPHCTVEVLRKEGSISQIKGKGNGSIHPNYISAVLDLITKYLKLPVNDSSMDSLGYRADKILMDLLDSDGKLYQYITVGGTKYLYKYTKITDRKKGGK